MRELSESEKRILKEIIKALHAGACPGEVKESFDALGDVGPLEVAQAEEELIAEGMTPKEVRSLCRVHLAVFREPPERQKSKASAGNSKIEAEEPGEEVTFETGSMTKDELEAMLNTLPVDITFVDKEDTIRYYSQPKERLFPRAKAVIGRTVQQCHPQKSINLINQILDDLRSGKKDSAEFWVDAGGRKIHIRYFAVRDSDGRYLGCVGVDQDITDIQKLEDERRLL